MRFLAFLLGLTSLTCLGAVLSHEDDLVVGTGTNAIEAGDLKLREDIGNGVNYVGFDAPDSLAGDQIWELPGADGAAGQTLVTDGLGVLSWASPFTNPMTTTGDIVYSSDNSGTPARLAACSADELLTYPSGIPACGTTLTRADAASTNASLFLANTGNDGDTFIQFDTMSSGTIDATWGVGADGDLAGFFKIHPGSTFSTNPTYGIVMDQDTLSGEPDFGFNTNPAGETFSILDSDAALLHLQTPSATGDTWMWFEGSVGDWSIGNDQSQSNAFRITQASSLSANSLFELQTDGDLGLGVTPQHPLHILENSTSTGPIVNLDQDGTGDSSLLFDLTATDWIVGADNSDADSFKIANSNDLGTTPRLIINQSTGETELNVRDDSSCGSGTLCSGVSFPTPVCVTNCDSCSLVGFQWVRLGNRTIWAFQVAANPTATSLYECRFDPPFATNYTNQGDVSGSCFSHEVDTGAAVFADTTNDDFAFRIVLPPDANQHLYKCSGMAAIF